MLVWCHRMRRTCYSSISRQPVAVRQCDEQRQPIEQLVGPLGAHRHACSVKVSCLPCMFCQSISHGVRACCLFCMMSACGGSGLGGRVRGLGCEGAVRALSYEISPTTSRDQSHKEATSVTSHQPYLQSPCTHTHPEQPAVPPHTPAGGPSAAHGKLPEQARRELPRACNQREQCDLEHFESTPCAKRVDEPSCAAHALQEVLQPFPHLAHKHT